MILVDTTEDSSNRKTKRSADLKKVITPSSLVHTQPLEYGDISFCGRGPKSVITVGVELKSISDLISSIRTGRLAAHQIPGLLEHFDLQWIVVEGAWKVSASGAIEVLRGKKWSKQVAGKKPVMYREITSWMASVSAQTGIHFWRTLSRTETAHWISNVYWCLQKRWEEHKSLKVFNLAGKPVLLPEVSKTAEVAHVVDGIGWDKALRMAQHFGSIRSLVNADEKALMGIDGIGKTLARRVVESWEETE